MSDDPDDRPEPASSPCLAHEFEPLSGPDLTRWRKAERARLIAARLAVPAETRAAAATEITRRLDGMPEICRGAVVSAWWPFKGELDLRAWLGGLAQRGATAALPVVVEKGAPLVFRPWWPGCAMTRGVWNIPIPETEVQVTPTVVLAPLVGVDAEGCRLGYGGGFFDRTLAGFEAKPLTIGIGLGLCRIPTIHPQWHDVPMDRVLLAGP